MDSAPASLELPLENIAIPDLKLTYNYWLGLRGDRWAPARDDMDPLDLPPRLLPRIMMVDVTRDPLDFHYRHWGTGVTDLHGEDMTNRPVRALRPPAFADLVWRQYAEVVERRAPALYLHEVPTKRGDWRRHAILRLPFSSNGEQVDIVMSLDDYGDGAEVLKPYYQESIARLR